MTVNDILELSKGNTIKVLKGKGHIGIDLENNCFLAIVGRDFTLNVHKTFEAALKEIKENLHLLKV